MADAPKENEVWFLGTRVSIRASFEQSSSGLSILERRAPENDSPPLPRYMREDEIFHVLEGELEFRLGDTGRGAGPGEIVLVPMQAPHTYRVVSSAGARWLTITTGKDFERLFARSVVLPVTQGCPMRGCGGGLSTAPIRRSWLWFRLHTRTS